MPSILYRNVAWQRFTAPQNPFEMLTNSETQLASAYYNVRIGGDMALLKGMMRLLIERDDAAVPHVALIA